MQTTEAHSAIVKLLQDYLQNPAASWAVGAFGAIGEFHMDRDEDVIRTMTPSGGELVTDRGAIRVSLPDEATLAPYEYLRKGPDRWLHGVNVCLPVASGGSTRRDRLTRVGPDNAAIREEDREHILYDMGLGLANIDVHIRTADPILIDLLDNAEGEKLLEPGSKAMAAIKEQSPHRVFTSRAGRVEVYQHIGSTAKGIDTPHGPHTHVIPKLLAHGKTHAANITVPEGYLPVLSLFPANPVLDDMGNARLFDHKDHQAFQSIMETYGPSAVWKAKADTIQAIRSGDAPETENLDRACRTAIRVAIRQLAYMDGETDSLTAWRTAFEPSADQEPFDPLDH